MAQFVDLAGRQFGRWTVLRRSEMKPRKGNYTLWDCRCECGRVGAISRASLARGQSKSCGCLNRELTRQRMTGNSYAAKWGLNQVN